MPGIIFNSDHLGEVDSDDLDKMPLETLETLNDDLTVQISMLRERIEYTFAQENPEDMEWLRRAKSKIKLWNIMQQKLFRLRSRLRKIDTERQEFLSAFEEVAKTALPEELYQDLCQQAEQVLSASIEV